MHHQRLPYSCHHQMLSILRIELVYKMATLQRRCGSSSQPLHPHSVTSCDLVLVAASTPPSKLRRCRWLRSMALLPRGCLAFMPLLLLAAVIAAIAVPAVAAAGTEWANEEHHRGRRSHSAPAAAPAEPPSTQRLYPSHGPAPAPGATATAPQGAEAPAPAPEAGDHSDGAAAVPVAWPVAVLAAAGVAAVMMV